MEEGEADGGENTQQSQFSEVMCKHLTRALEEKEEAIDREIQKYEDMNEDDLEILRRSRLLEMKKKAKEMNEYKSRGHGELTELHSEKEFFEASKVSKLLLVHFYRPSTWRCQILDKHLDRIAKKFVHLRCVKINVEKAPFLSERLHIVVLPTLMFIKDGKTDHSALGFDEFGGVDDFKTSAVEMVLRNRGMLSQDGEGED